ncbi:MAG: sigma-54 interaction domain-containing protein [Porticoccaceae bacterium]
MSKTSSTAFKDDKLSAVLLVTDKASQAIATAFQQLLPHWQWQVLDGCSGLSGVVDPDALVGFIIAPQNLDQGACLWAERVTQSCHGLLWIAIVGEHHCADLDFMRVVAATCHDFITTPLEQVAELLPGMLGHAAGLARLRAQLLDGGGRPADLPAMVGSSPPMKRLSRLTAKFARADAPVMICGESGTGKELVAQAIHRASARADGPFVAINCGAIPENLLESELFGHVKGAFTGAVQDRAGRAELADGGTLFLDEIGDLPLSHQVKILRFLQEGRFERVGSGRCIQVDVRIVAATHRDLEAGVQAQTFREDLFYRLNVLRIEVPPLRERGADIESLAEHFLAQARAKTNTTANGFSAEARLALRGYRWPGNVRELINRVSKAAILAEGSLINPADLDLPIPREPGGARIINLQETREQAERAAVESALRDADYNISRAASLLGVSRMTIYRLLDKHGIEIS